MGVKLGVWKQGAEQIILIEERGNSRENCVMYSSLNNIRVITKRRFTWICFRKMKSS
jgi:hypothetical protein